MNNILLPLNVDWTLLLFKSLILSFHEIIKVKPLGAPKGLKVKLGAVMMSKSTHMTFD